MHPFKGPTARALKRAIRYPRELRAKARDHAALTFALFQAHGPRIALAIEMRILTENTP
jgi:hypothetical protein